MEAVWAVKAMGRGIYVLVLSKRETEAGRGEERTRPTPSPVPLHGGSPLWGAAASSWGAQFWLRPARALASDPARNQLPPSPREPRTTAGQEGGGVLGFSQGLSSQLFLLRTPHLAPKPDPHSVSQLSIFSIEFIYSLNKHSQSQPVRRLG